MWCVQMCEWDGPSQKWVPMSCVPVAWNCDAQEAKDKARRLNRAYQSVFDVWFEIAEVERQYRAIEQKQIVAGV